VHEQQRRPVPESEAGLAADLLAVAQVDELGAYDAVVTRTARCW
jgi:hypothetical protein